MHYMSSPVGLLALFLAFSSTTSALSIKRPARSLSYEALGCYTDNANGKRALNGKSTAADDMSVQKCATFCSHFELFGVEYGRECYCGDSRDSGSIKADDSDCSFPCPSDPLGAEMCGAGDRLNLYSNLNVVTTKPATLPGVTSLGCFVDTGDRVLPKGYASSQDMTAAKCAQNCAGYRYFGTEYSSECFCGDAAPATSAPASECNMVCSGNSDELCGGGMRLNVYKVEIDTTSTSISSSAIAQSTPIAPPATFSGYEYQGCYTDNVPQRVLSGKFLRNSAMTVETCADFCKIGGYSWFGVEYSSECYCGTTLDTLSVKGLESACDAKCGGDTSQSCGGANLLNLYKNPNLAAPAQQSSISLNGFTYKSCWTDKVDDRSLKAVDFRTDDMTIEKCSERCKDYAYFGLEYGRECYCGDAVLGQAAPAAECGMLCVGANNEWCGGPDRLNLYARASASDIPSNSASKFLSLSSSTDLAISSSTSSESSSSISTATLDASLIISSSTISETTTETSLSSIATVSSTISESLSSISSSASFSTSFFLPSSTSMTPTTTSSSGPALTTITACPAAPTYVGTPEYCYVSDKLPGQCTQLTKNNFYAMSMSMYLAQCRAALTVYDMKVAMPATSCFPSIAPGARPNQVSGLSTISSVLSCLSAPSNSLFCQFDSSCATKTYTIGQEPAPTSDSSVGTDVLKNGGFEDGSLGDWIQGSPLNAQIMRPTVSQERPRSGNYGISLKYDNSNGASVSWTRATKVIPGKTYQFQVYFWVTNTYTNCGLNVYASQVSLPSNQLQNVPTNQWVARSLTFQATRSIERLQVYFGCNVRGDVNSAASRNDVWLDDWTLTQLD